MATDFSKLGGRANGSFVDDDGRRAYRTSFRKTGGDEEAGAGYGAVDLDMSSVSPGSASDDSFIGRGRRAPTNASTTSADSGDGKQREGTSNLETVMHIVKANVGTGVLAMPFAFKKGGLVLSSVALWVMGVICIHCMHLLLNCYRHVIVTYDKQRDAPASYQPGATDPSTGDAEQQRANKKANETIGYDDVVVLVVQDCFPTRYRLHKYTKAVMSFFLIVAQLGFCCVYLVFVPTNLKQVLDAYLPGSGLSVQHVMAIVVAPLMLFCLIKNLKILAPFSMFANLLIMSCMVAVLYQLFFSGPFKPMRELTMVTPYESWPVYFSTAVYAFEGINLVLPVYHEMRDKANFQPWNGALNVSMSLVAILYFSIGFFGYLKYGDAAQSSITLDLPNKSLLFQIVKVLFSVAIFISYNLQFFVAADILWSAIYRSSRYLQRSHNFSIKFKKTKTATSSSTTGAATLSPSASSAHVELTEEDESAAVTSDDRARIVDSRVTLKPTKSSSSRFDLRSIFTAYNMIETAFRFALVLVTFALSVSIPRIDLFISLVGAVACSIMAIILPPVLDLLLFWKASGYSALKLAKDLVIILFGVYIFMAGTYVSIDDIVKYFRGAQ